MPRRHRFTAVAATTALAAAAPAAAPALAQSPQDQLPDVPGVQVAVPAGPSGRLTQALDELQRAVDGTPDNAALQQAWGTVSGVASGDANAAQLRDAWTQLRQAARTTAAKGDGNAQQAWQDVQRALGQRGVDISSPQLGQALRDAGQALTGPDGTVSADRLSQILGGLEQRVVGSGPGEVSQPQIQGRWNDVKQAIDGYVSDLGQHGTSAAQSPSTWPDLPLDYGYGQTPSSGGGHNGGTAAGD